MFRNFSVVRVGYSRYKVIHHALKSSPKRLLHVSHLGVLQSWDKDIASPKLPKSVEKLHSQDTDILLEQIRKARSLPRLLELVSTHLDVMNNQHIVSTFDIIYGCLAERRNKCVIDESSLDLTSDPTFQALCNRTLKRARFFEPSEVMNVYKTLTILRVKHNTYIMQAMLKMMCSQINELTLSELSFLNFLLHKQKSSVAVDGLKMALPLVLQVQIEQQLDSSNVNEVVSCLKVCSTSRLKPSTMEKIIESLGKFNVSLTPEQAHTVIVSLLHLETPVNGYLELINKAFFVAMHNIDSFQNGQILHIIRLCNRTNFFHKGYFIASAKKAVSDAWNAIECNELQGNFFRLEFYYEDLLHYLNKAILNDPNFFKMDNKLLLLVLARHFALTDCKPPNIDVLLDMLCNSDEQLSFMYENYPDSYLHFVSFLCMLGYFHSKILEQCLNEKFLLKAWSIARKYGRTFPFEQSLCSLRWFLDVQGKGNFQVPTSIFEQVFQSIQNRVAHSCEYPLTKFIENGIGGDQFLCTGMFTKNGHSIDHVLAMRNGNFPVSLSLSSKKPANPNVPQNINFIEDLSVPCDAKIVTIIVAKNEHYWKDPENLNGWMKFKIRSLSVMGFFPVVINYTNWYNLPDREKITYLMCEIKQAIENETLSKVNSPQ